MDVRGAGGGSSDYAIPSSVLSSGGVPVAAGVYCWKARRARPSPARSRLAAWSCALAPVDPLGMRVFLPTVLKNQ